MASLDVNNSWRLSWKIRIFQLFGLVYLVAINRIFSPTLILKRLTYRSVSVQQVIKNLNQIFFTSSGGFCKRINQIFNTVQQRHWANSPSYFKQPLVLTNLHLCPVWCCLVSNTERCLASCTQPVNPSCKYLCLKINAELFLSIFDQLQKLNHINSKEF